MSQPPQLEKITLPGGSRDEPIQSQKQEAATSENVITRMLYRARTTNSAGAAASSSGASPFGTADSLASAGGASPKSGLAASGDGADSTTGSSRPQSAVTPGAGGAAGEGEGSGSGSGGASSSAFSNMSKVSQPFFIRIEGHDVEEAKGAEPIIKSLLRRDAYKGKEFDKGALEPRVPAGEEQAALSKIELVLADGVYEIEGLQTVPVGWKQYINDLTQVFTLLENGPWLSLARTRLVALEEKFELFSLLNADLEEAFDAHFGGGGVFGRSVKVDNAVRLATSVTADVLVENIRRAARHRAADVVHIDQHGVPMTFRDLTDELGVDASVVTAEGLGLHPPARKEASKRYDVLDPDMNPSGVDGVELLSLFLECHGTNSGRFFADLIRPVLERRETVSSMTQASLNICGEYKLPILGMRLDEWSVVARWICEHSLTQMQRAVYSVEIPRVDRKRNEYDCRTAEDQIRNIFYPMFMATINPQDPEYHHIAVALMKIGSICISSDEKVRRTTFSADEPRPPASFPWSTSVMDDYAFFYYVWANLCTLNALRRKFGLNVFQFRTICSEATPHWDHLVVSFLLADVVEQAGKLDESWNLQYLYYMARIGVSLSPISSNGAGVSLFESPFPRLFKRGLMVSLSSADPLHFHHNAEPLVEEYGTAQSVFELSTSDMAEIARTSILVSNFGSEHKVAWLGPMYALGPDGNDSSKSHVSDVRLAFRHECLMQEQSTLNLAVSQGSSGSKPSGGGGGSAGGSSAGGGKPAPALLNLFRASASRSEEKSNSTIAKLRELQRINSIDRRVPLTRIVIDGPPADVGGGALVRAHASMLRGAITLRSRYRLTHDGDYGAAGGEAASSGAATTVGAGGGGAGHSSNTNNNNNKDGGPASPASVGGSAQQASFYGAGTGGGLAGGVGASMRFGDDDHALERAFRISDSSFDPTSYSYSMYYGVCLIHLAGTSPTWPDYIPTFEMFMSDVAMMRKLVTENSGLNEFCHLRLRLLEHKFGLHLALNVSKECGEVRDRELNNRDFYTAHKVDNNVQTEACMNARVLFHYFTERARLGQNDVVFERNKKPITLREYLQHELGVDIERLTVDELTNLLSSHQQLRALFLSPDNYMGGRYFAELTKHTLEQYKNDRFSFAENRLPIYGRSRSEWDVLASWCDRYGMVSTQSRWLARISRGYRHLRLAGAVDNFGDYLNNIFMPLWEVSLSPAKFPRLHHFLTYVSGFDCEGNEQKVDMTLEHKPPHEWNSTLNPPFNYYMYYLWANITALNVFRSQRGLNVFSFRPQAGESGSLDHLIGAFLVADGISHGVTLKHSPTLQYLFYVTQLPIAMSPLSNTNVIPYLDHPFSHFFSRGLNVSLATNKPLFNHFTSEPLIEEYSLASKIWKLQNGDLSELALNSVRMSDFSPMWKRKALGPLYPLHSTLGNDVNLSRVSDFRVAYRYETYHSEIDYLDELFALDDLRQWISTWASGVVAGGNSTAAAAGHNTPLLNRTSSKFPSEQVMEATRSTLTPFPRAMRLLEAEVEMYQLRMATRVFMPAAFGEQEEEMGLATMVTQLKQQVGELNREVTMKNLEVGRMFDEQIALATDIKTAGQRISALASSPSTTVDAALV